MAQFFVMPQASPTMTVGVIAKWLAPEGSALTSSQAIAAVETDKATMDIEVFDKGVMLKHLAKEGQEVPPGQPIAIIGLKADEDVSALVAEYAALMAGAAPAASVPASAGAAEVAVVPAATPAPVAAATAPTPPPSPATDPGHSEATAWGGHAVDDAFMESRPAFRPPAARVMASPLARQLAAEAGVSITKVRGSGPGGRIVAADVEAAAARGSGRGVTRAPDATVRATQMRKTIARRLTEVHQQVPAFFLTTSFEATAIVALKELVGKRAGKDGQKVSVNDILVRCVAQALREVPEVNAQWTGDAIVRKGGVDVGIAVALPEGLITPVVRDADQKSILEIGAEVRALAGRAKEGKLAPEEYTGGSFTVSNLGMFEIEHFTAILNAPEAAILAVGSAAKVPHVVGEAVVAQWRMKVTLTCDHRVIDGALGARFLQVLRQYVENPGLLGVG